MNILLRNKSPVQFCCHLVAGELVFEKRLPAADGTDNYPKFNRVVVDRDEVDREWHDYYSCRKLNHTRSQPCMGDDSGSKIQTCLNQGGVDMDPADFIHKKVSEQLLFDGFPPDVALRGADKAVEYYRKSSQASRKGRMYDDCLSRGRDEARFQTPQNERKHKPARNPKTRQEKLL